MKYRHLLRLMALPFAFSLWFGFAPSVFADVPVTGSGIATITFVTVFERAADGNTFFDYTFIETSTGIFDGTRTGSGELVIHADGTFNTQNDGTFTGTIDGVSGQAEMAFWGSGTFAAAGGNFTVTHGTGGLAGVHAQGSDSGSATGPTTFVANYSFKVNFGAA